MKIASRVRTSLRAIVVASVLLLVFALAFFYRDLLLAAVTPNPVPHDAESISRGSALWSRSCAVCHGAQGRGDGPITASLKKKPKDLTRIANPPVFPDGVLAYRIANGGEVMPAWGGALTEQDIWDLVNYIRAQHR